MSTYTSGGGLLRACNDAVRAAVPELGRISQALADGLNAAAFNGLAAALKQENPSIQTIENTWARLDSAAPRWAAVLSDGVVTNLQQAQDLTALAQRTAGGPTQVTAVAEASQALKRALEAGAAEVATVQRLAFAETAHLALSNLGYSIDRAEGPHTTALEARRGHEVLLATFGDDGLVEFDHAGLTGNACLDRQGAVHTEMRRLGVTLEVFTRTDHRDHRGGVRIAAAARRGRGSLARGAVKERETLTARSPRPLRLSPDRAATADRGRVAG